MVDEGEQRRLDELRLPQGRAHGDYGFAGEHHRPFGHRLDVAGEPEIFERREELLAEDAERREIGDVLRRKVQLAYILDRLLETRRHRVGVAAPAAVKEVERRAAHVHAALEIAVRHGQLIEVGEHGEIALTAHFKLCHLSAPSREAPAARLFFSGLSFQGVRRFSM